MNAVRLLINTVLAFLCFWGGASLLARDSFFLRDRWHPDFGTRFSGPPLYLLASGLFFLGLFAAAVALAWARGRAPMPDAGELRPHPDEKGRLILRYWYFVGAALISIAGAFMLAQHVPDPARHPAPAAERGR